MIATRGLRLRPVLGPGSFRTLSGSFRHFHVSPNKQNTVGVNLPLVPKAASETPIKVDLAAYLQNFKMLELLLYLVIGAATLNKPILNLCIKLFPYVPMPIIKALVYKIYCGGETIEDVKNAGLRLSKRGINNMMISLTIEACEGNDNVDPDYIVAETQKSVENILIPHTVKMITESGKDINAIPPGYVALKPTGFSRDAARVLRDFKAPETAPLFDELVSKAASVCSTIYNANEALAKQYPDRVAPFVVGVIDAEKHELQEGVYELQRRLYELYNPLNRPVSVVGTLQMYLTGSADLLALEERMATEKGYRLGLKLVRGAYIHSEKQRNTVIHASKEDTDKNYNQGISYCIESILAHPGNEAVIGHLVVASHNADSLKLATEKVYRNPQAIQNANKNNVCLGQLLGMADNVTHDLIKNYNVDNVIKYVAWGPPVETKEYLLRRLEENGDAVKNDNGFPLIKTVVSVLYRRMMGRA